MMLRFSESYRALERDVRAVCKDIAKLLKYVVSSAALLPGHHIVRCWPVLENVTSVAIGLLTLTLSFVMDGTLSLGRTCANCYFNGDRVDCTLRKEKGLSRVKQAKTCPKSN